MHSIVIGFVTIISKNQKSAGTTLSELRFIKLTPTGYDTSLEKDVFKTKSTLHGKEIEGHNPPRGAINNPR